MRHLRLFWYRAWAWLRWRRKAVGPHGVHSPFVYELLSNVLKTKGAISNRANRELPAWLLEYRNEIRHDTTLVELQDFGAGTLDKPLRTRKEQVRKIARRSGASFYKLLIIKRLVQFLQPSEVVEFGTNLGLSACALSSAGASVQTVEASEALCLYVKHQQEKAWSNTSTNKHFLFSTIHSTFSDYKTNTRQIQTYDLAYLDGDHTEQATLANGTWLLERLVPGGLLIVDDIYWSPGMERAWNMLCQHPSVTVSIDLYHLGLLFVKRPQAREHFVLRT